MAGYIRQDTTNNIADGNVINASDFDNEYNAIEAAFHATTGHTHDGTSAEGAPITKIGPTQDVVASATALTPKTDNTVDLGSSTLEYKDLFIDGTANIDSLVADTADINAGTIDGVTIGGASAGAATFTTVGATTGNITTVNATTVDTTNLEVTNIKAKDGTASMTLADATGVASFSANPVLSGGTANGVLYLNGSKVATSGTAMIFDGTNLGIGISPVGKLDVYATGTTVGYVRTANQTLKLTADDSGNRVDLANVAGNPMSFTIGVTEQMRLTSTGLGIGTSSPSVKLHVVGSQYRQNDSTGSFGFTLNTTSATTTLATLFGGSSFAIQTAGSGTNQLLLDSSGNLGLGVTPSAWTIRGLQVASSSVANDGNDTYLTANGFFDGSWKYINSDFAAQYYQVNGVHAWRIAPSGTAGNAISFTQAMTLDASGNLLVGTTSSSYTDVGVRVMYDASNPYITNTCASSASGATSYNLYSTGAGAFRFYVNLAGTVFATNTTISAISDQRFKENIRDLDVGLNAVMALKPRKFDWKAGKGKDKKDDRGFIAQEFEQVFPDLIDEWKDPAPEGEEPYKAVRADLIPVLVKAIQEQQALITDLRARVAALESN